MSGTTPKNISRRRFLEAAGTTALPCALGPAVIIPAHARQRTLRILQWKHFVPGYDEWFNGNYVEAWGNANNTQVIVDNVGLADLSALARSEAKAQHGHDLVMFLVSPSTFEDQTIDHREIQEECERRHGKALDFAVRSTYNPKSKRYFGFCHAFLPAMMTYRKDLWDAVGMQPDTWEAVWRGGRRIKLLHEIPVGISLASEHNSNHTLRAIMYSFGSSVQDADGNPTLKTPQSLEAIKFLKSLYQEAMTEDVLGWNAASNNRVMLAGDGSITLDTISISRAAENTGLRIAEDLLLSRTPRGPVARLAPSFGTPTYLIWKFADNVEGAKQFLVDYVDHSRAAFLASGFQNMPSFPGAVPDVFDLTANDAGAIPAGKYSLLKDGATWTTNAGHPGYSNAAIDEIFALGLIPDMFARAATGRSSPEEALDDAARKVANIYQKWRDAGRL